MVSEVWSFVTFCNSSDGTGKKVRTGDIVTRLVVLSVHDLDSVLLVTGCRRAKVTAQKRVLSQGDIEAIADILCCIGKGVIVDGGELEGEKTVDVVAADWWNGC